MDALTMNEKMIEWANLQRRADVLRAELTAEVMAQHTDFTVSGIAVAKYFPGRTDYDWETAVFEDPRSLEALTGYLKLENLKDRIFTEVGKKFELTPPVKSKSAPSVKFTYVTEG